MKCKPKSGLDAGEEGNRTKKEFPLHAPNGASAKKLARMASPRLLRADFSNETKRREAPRETKRDNDGAGQSAGP